MFAYINEKLENTTQAMQKNNNIYICNNKINN